MKPAIVIQTDTDLTPPGKRTYKAVLGSAGIATHIRWYVSGRKYRTLPLSPENYDLSKQWRDAGKAVSK